jgi:hypothetical protein
MSRALRLILATAPLLLAGCDLLGIETPEQIAAKKQAEGQAIGAGCRHAGRSLETCYEMNKRADKAAMFAGWKEMSEYMAENKIEVSPPPAAAAEDTPDSADAAASGADGEKVAARDPK